MHLCPNLDFFNLKFCIRNKRKLKKSGGYSFKLQLNGLFGFFFFFLKKTAQDNNCGDKVSKKD